MGLLTALSYELSQKPTTLHMLQQVLHQHDLAANLPTCHVERDAEMPPLVHRLRGQQTGRPNRSASY